MAFTRLSVLGGQRPSLAPVFCDYQKTSLTEWAFSQLFTNYGPLEKFY